MNSTNMKTTATVDGQKVVVDILENDIDISQKDRTVPGWKLALPLIIIGAVLLVVLIVSVTMFFWALPVLLPIALIFIIMRSLGGR